MKRRIRRIRRALKRAGLYNAFHIALIAVLLTGFCVILFNVKEPEQQEEKPETTQAEVIQNPETMTQMTESIEDKYKVFDTMSEDWGSDDLEGFVFYDLPEKYADKGYFPEKMQIYTRCLCKQNDVPYALILAIIEYESGYEFDKTGDNGNSKGYMQIYEKWHTDRMQKLNCTDLMNPSKKATTACKEVTERAEDALQNQEQLEATLNTATQIRQDVSQMQTAVAEAKKQVEQDKKDIDDTIQNSLLASAEKILESVQDYFNRAEALYSSMYLDCDGETPYLRTVTPIFIDGATPQVRNANEGVDFDGGTPTSRQLAV